LFFIIEYFLLVGASEPLAGAATNKNQPKLYTTPIFIIDIEELYV
jgi:hypothetical protein